MFRIKYCVIITLIGFCTGLPAIAIANDAGIPDTVKLEGGPLAIGQSIPLSLTIVNDFPVGSFSLGFIFDDDQGGGFAVFDSVVYVNRMSDPRVFAFRIAKRWDTDPEPPDTVIFGGEAYAQLDLPPGNDATTLAYFTGVSAGDMTVDSGFFPPAGSFILVNSYGMAYTPQCVTHDIEVIEGNPPPQITINTTTPRIVCGTEVEFEVEAASPVGFPVSFDSYTLTGYDDETILPINSPNLGSGNPATFTWNTTCDDLGIWLATFEVCDSSGTCATVSIDIQVVEDQSHLMSFSMTELQDVCRANTIQHGNFDSDGYLELAGSGGAEIRLTPTLALFDCNGSSSFSVAFHTSDQRPAFGLGVGYLDDDEDLDAVMMKFYSIGAQYFATTYLGNGNNGFNDTLMSPGNHSRGRGSVIGEFTGDNYLDFALATGNVKIFEGNGLGRFSEVDDLNPGGGALSINSADFNDDGYDDFAAGTATGVYIYLGNGSGGFTQTAFYNQVYGSIDIEITNQGSDFNNDNIFDLCISTPSAAGPHSEMVVYLGNGDGTFTQDVIRNVKGQIFGNCVGDFNNDGDLDIAFVNGAQEYLAILFGDGTGTFASEIRYPIPHHNPCQIDNYDVNLDGDVDIVIIAHGAEGYNSLFYLENNLDPGGFMQTDFNISGCDNIVIELTSSSGKVFNRIKSLMPSAKYFRRDINENGTLDEYATLGVVESGEYILTAWPRPDLPVGNHFTIEYTLNGELYRLARDIPMTESGYDFGICAGGDCSEMPRSGKFIKANPPSFIWGGAGPFDFQLASDIDFSSLIVDVTVEDNIYSPMSALEATDTALYYWRVKPQSSPDYDCLYAVNIVHASGGAGDANGDGLTNVGDVVFVINYVFRGGPAPDPVEAGDANCDDAVNIGDAVSLISYIFGGGPAPNCP
jgi:hypothetical protein